MNDRQRAMLSAAIDDLLTLQNQRAQQRGAEDRAIDSLIRLLEEAKDETDDV